MDVDCGINNVDCNHIQNQDSRTNVSFWRSAANYTRMDCGVKHFGKSVVVKQFPNRAGTFRCATMEEIEAEKSLIEKDTKQRMEKSIETVRSNFNSVRTNRANPSMLDRVEVDYYGSPVSLKSIAQISTPDASSILISPYDKSSDNGGGDDVWNWVGMGHGVGQSHRQGRLGWGWVVTGVVSVGVGRGWGGGRSWLGWLSGGSSWSRLGSAGLKAIEKAIVTAQLGITPNNDGDIIRLSLPPLTSERRKVVFNNLVHGE
ncbi:Ribosome-recycling factor chloroplastic [Bienertia sinuspersici]